MRHEDILKEKYGTATGYRVPDGYFEELNASIMASLPAYPEKPRAVRLSAWQRVKPYVYLAAMFAGIWVMMKMFHTVSMADRLTLDNPPEAIVQAFETDDFDIMPLYSPASDLELEEEVSENYSSMDDFEADFGYELTPEYASMNVLLPQDGSKNT